MKKAILLVLILALGMVVSSAMGEETDTSLDFDKWYVTLETDTSLELDFFKWFGGLSGDIPVFDELDSVGDYDYRKAINEQYLYWWAEYYLQVTSLVSDDSTLEFNSSKE